MDFWPKIILTGLFLLALPQLKRFIKWFTMFWYWRRMVIDFPGPPSIYFIGCLKEFRGGLKGFFEFSEFFAFQTIFSALPDFLLTQSAKAIESGENVMRIWLGPILRIYVLDAEAVKVKFCIVFVGDMVFWLYKSEND
jgi:hypothetical protein